MYLIDVSSLHFTRTIKFYYLLYYNLIIELKCYNTKSILR